MEYRKIKSEYLKDIVEIGIVEPSLYNQVLILLHGYGGTIEEVSKFFKLEEYAKKYHMLIVVPELGNQFYMDREINGKWISISKFLAEELPAFIRTEYQLNDELDMLLGGYSMGGFGTMLHGLNNSHSFKALISVSGAFAASEIAYGSPFLVGTKKKREIAYEIFMIKENEIPYEVLMEDIHRNPLAIVEQMDGDTKRTLPKLFFSCGSQDIWKASTMNFKRTLEKNAVDFYFLEIDGGHDDGVFDQGFRWALSILAGLNEIQSD